ncbi:hypothetical protein FF38_08646 [Lucilia cuprina]|uniref:C2H2-type domain-containing protein n=1 Tax=Lucilia cuprina TaxID=7375 RepID=A0A0L0BVG4_LUCCU|nr:Zinc finger protein 701 [Lucilia cuprina]KNC24055.1 hypothetical protein FF38_08646 [Lucilia cuprina]
MELNDYNGFENHCKNNEIDLKDKFVRKESHNTETMDQIMHRKEQEFIDHTLLAPEYMRDPNHFIMDLINFPKTETSTHNNGDHLTTDLHFHNSLFPVSADVPQQTNEPRKTESNSVFLPLNNDFLMPVQKSYNTTVDSVTNVDENGVKVVQQLLLTNSVTLDDTSIDDDSDLTRFNSRKILPHKKRISRKLKINHCDSNLQLNVPLEDHKLAHVDQLVVGPGSIQQFRCELCGHVTCSQLDFFAHLKQHYEPSTPDTILAAMKTSLDVLGPEKTSDDLCTIKKTDGLEQVFQDVHFPFENFTQAGEAVSVRVVMEPQHHQQGPDTLSDTTINVANASLQTASHNQPHQQQPQQTTSNLVPEEFSDTEDMLEGIRDKVLIEDTCDTMDLMTPTSNGGKPHWFTNNCFNGIDLKAKPFCDVLFSGQFAPILNTEPTVPLMPAEPHLTSGKQMHRELEQNQLQTSVSTIQQPTPTQPVQNNAHLRLEFSHSEPSLLHNGQCLNNEQHQIPLPPHQLNDHQILEAQHIKIEETPPHISDNPYQNSEDTLSGNELEPEEELHEQNENSDDEYSSHLDRSDEIFSYSQLKAEDCDESLLNDNGEEICLENDQNNENGKRKRYICNKCQRIFNSCNALKYHNRTHSGLRPHQCEICDKSFFAIGALKAHTRTHTGDKPFECKHCDRKFRQWGDLKYHTISIHSTEKNHQCEFCGKAFSRKYSLVVHLRIHTSERNYKCEFCTKTFRASTYLQNHRKIHTGEKPYECDVCSKRFRVSGDLRRHQRIHERKKQKLELLKKNTET